jgi:hypothetical protein
MGVVFNLGEDLLWILYLPLGAGLGKGGGFGRSEVVNLLEDYVVGFSFITGSV